MYFKYDVMSAEKSLSILQESTLEEIDEMTSPEAPFKICTIMIKFSSIDKITLCNSRWTSIGTVDMNFADDDTEAPSIIYQHKEKVKILHS